MNPTKIKTGKSLRAAVENILRPQNQRAIVCGDNLAVLRQMPNACVDLIYLDPPFNSKRLYHGSVAGKENKNKVDASFKDIWNWEDDAAEAGHMAAMNEGLESVVRTALVLDGGRKKSNAAYLVFMGARLLELRRVLKPTGALYLHCDPTMSHWLKLALDAIFGDANFHNEILWCYERGGRGAKQWAKKHDVILFYSKTADYFFDGAAVRLPRKKTRMKIITDNDGESYQVKTDKKSGKEYRYPLRAGITPPDWWVGIQQLNRSERERTGYPTQKPLALLDRIIKASSEKGDLLLDPFCGCATACVAAQQLGRKWIGLDLVDDAIDILGDRLAETPEHGGIGALDVHYERLKLADDYRAEPPTAPDRNRRMTPREKDQCKEILFGRQRGKCAGINCGLDVPFKNLELDHILPNSRGGTDELENFQLLCGHCNRSKGKRTMEEWRLQLKKSSDNQD